MSAHTPKTDKALKATQGLFRAAAECNGFADHARKLEHEHAALLSQVARLREVLKTCVSATETTYGAFNVCRTEPILPPKLIESARALLAETEQP